MEGMLIRRVEALNQWQIGIYQNAQAKRKLKEIERNKQKKK